MKKAKKVHKPVKKSAPESVIKLERFSYEFYLALIMIITLATLLIDVIILIRLR